MVVFSICLAAPPPFLFFGLFLSGSFLKTDVSKVTEGRSMDGILNDGGLSLHSRATLLVIGSILFFFHFLVFLSSSLSWTFFPSPSSSLVDYFSGVPFGSPSPFFGHNFLYDKTAIRKDIVFSGTPRFRGKVKDRRSPSIPESQELTTSVVELVARCLTESLGWRLRKVRLSGEGSRAAFTVLLADWASASSSVQEPPGPEGLGIMSTMARTG